jgi:hypothetical protein
MNDAELESTIVTPTFRKRHLVALTLLFDDAKAACGS